MSSQHEYGSELFILSAMSRIISQSERLSPTGLIAFLILFIFPSKFVKEPSFSAKLAAGNTTVANFAVSVKNKSCPTRNSRKARESLTAGGPGSLNTGRVPTTQH